jgi:hypothetical protein
VCQQRQDLFQRFSEAMKTLLSYLKLQTDAVIAGDPDFDQLDRIIEAAKVWKKETGEAYNAHVCNHACGCPFNSAPGDDGSKPPAGYAETLADRVPEHLLGFSGEDYAHDRYVR